eukprot:5475415-Pyramimonas_sp.AAC.1
MSARTVAWDLIEGERMDEMRRVDMWRPDGPDGGRSEGWGFLGGPRGLLRSPPRVLGLLRNSLARCLLRSLVPPPGPHRSAADRRGPTAPPSPPARMAGPGHRRAEGEDRGRGCRGRGQ